MVRYEDQRPPPPDRSRQSHYNGHRSREHTPPHPGYQHDDPRHHYRHHQSGHPDLKRNTSAHYDRAAPSRFQSWPPYPLVEDERISLAREVNPFFTDPDQVDPLLRGSLDQTPIILEVEDGQFTPAEPNTAKPRESGSMSRGSRHQSAAHPTPPARVNSRKKGRPNAPQFISADFAGAPEISSRSPSTYAFTPKTRTPDARDESRASYDSGYFSTPDAKTTLLADKRKEALARGVTDAIVSDALRGQGKTRESFSSHQRQPSGLGSDSGRASLAGSVVSDASSRSGKDGSNRPRLAELKKEALHSHRRTSDSATATMTTTPHPEAEDAPRTAIRAGASRPESPAFSPTTKYPPSPPRSPRHSPNQSKDDLHSRRTSTHSSLPGSRVSSRPSSPKPFESPETLRRSGTFPTLPEDRTQRTSRLASFESAGHEGDLRTPTQAPLKSAALPYPVDDMNLMPSEEDHKYKPRGLGIEEVPSPSMAAHRMSMADKRPSLREAPKIDTSHRPRLDSRHTYDGGLSASTGALASPTASGSPFSATPLGPRALPPCPRQIATRDYDDWLTLDGLPDFDICPACYQANFATGPFCKRFKRAHHSSREMLRCDFSSPWIRLAWLLTLERKRYDLDLLYAVARAGAKEPCSGSQECARVWYTVKDSHGEKVDGFDVCPTDVKRVEALLPGLHGLFTRAHHGHVKTRTCDFRIKSKRFHEYLDHLIELDDTAHARRRPPELSRFAELAIQKAQTRECSRDDPTSNLSWHFPPQMPAFTVCEECYSDVVWPEIAQGSSVAGRFVRTPQLVHRERRGSLDSVGTTCQLYSTRMRKVFRKAVATSDFGYLARRAAERLDAEQDRHERLNSLRRLSSDSSQHGHKPSMQVEHQRITDEWRKYE